MFTWRVRFGPPRPGLPAPPRGLRSSPSKFFQTDTLERKVGSATYRATRRMAFDIRKTAIRSMKRSGRSRKRYTDLAAMPARLQQMHLRARRRWHQSGERWPEPKLPHKPSDRGKPPRVISGDLVKGPYAVFAEPAGGMTPRTAIKADRVTFKVGPKKRPRGDNNAGNVPELHEHGGVGVGSDGKTAYFPKRPFMRPAYNKRIGEFDRFLREEIRRSVK